MTQGAFTGLENRHFNAIFNKNFIRPWVYILYWYSIMLNSAHHQSHKQTSINLRDRMHNTPCSHEQHSRIQDFYVLGEALPSAITTTTMKMRTPSKGAFPRQGHADMLKWVVSGVHNDDHNHNWTMTRAEATLVQK